MQPANQKPQKNPMETEAITVRPLKSVTSKLRALAKQSGLSLSAYASAILTDAAKRGALAQLVEQVDIVYAQDELELNPKKKR